MNCLPLLRSFFTFCLAIVAVSVLALPAQAQPVTVIEPTTDTDVLLQALLGPSGSITVTEVEYTGAAGAIGTFTEGPLGMPRGIVISSGLVEDMSYREPKTEPSTALGTGGHPLCDQLTDPATSQDAAALRIVFDISDDVDGIIFDHVVGTEEYPEWLNQGFNDGFGVFLNGQNIALSVDDNPVTVNDFFTTDEVIEHPDNETNFNAGTPLFSSRSDLSPGSTDNELVIVVCDAGDGLYDTGGFVSLLDACSGDCDTNSQCGDGILQDGEDCDGELIDPELAECPDGYQGAPLCNNDPANPDGDGSCRLDPIPDGCEEIIFCDENPGVCGEGDCVNISPGDYTCDCDDGYEFDGTTCVDFDQCADDANNDCDENAECTDLEGGFECDCLPGFSGPGDVCLVDVSLDSPATGTVTNDPRTTISGTGEPGEEITIYVNGVAVGNTTVDGDGNWSYTPDADLPEGTVEITAADAYSDDSVTIEIDTTAPSLVILTPDGLGNDSQPEFTGTTEPNAEVTIQTDDGPVTVTADGDGNWSWTPPDELEDGEYEWEVTATDAAGNTTTETAEFEIDTAPPALTVLTPQGPTNDPQPTVTGTSDPNAEITIDTGDEVVTVTADGDGNWEWTPEEPLDDGEYEWTVSTTNDAGNEATGTAEFEVDTVAPMIQIRVPGDGDILSSSPDAIEGDAEPFAQVDIFINGEEIGTTTADENGEWTYELDDDLEDGEYEAVARATDPAGNQSEDSVDFIVDTTAEVVILQPAEGSVVRTTTPTVSGEAEPGAQIDIIIDGEVVDTVEADEDGTWTWTSEEELEEGEITVTAQSDSPAAHEDSVTFEIDPSTTEVSIDEPSDGDLINDSQPTFSGSAEPGATVVIYVDGEEVDTVEADENGNWEWTPEEDLPEGELTVTVVADDDGMESEASVDITIDTIPPSLVVNEPEEDSVVPSEGAVVSGTSEPGATIIVYVDGEPVGSTTADEDGNWSVPLPDDMEEGERDLRVTATDAAGNMAVVERHFIVDEDDDGGDGDGDADGDGEFDGDGDFDDIDDDDLEEMGFISGGGPACSSTSGSGTSFLLLVALFGLMALRRRHTTDD